MFITRTVVILGIASCLSATAMGQEGATSPATQPAGMAAPVEAVVTTQPATTEPAFVADQTTPKGAAILLARAMSAGDRDAVGKLIFASEAQVKFMQNVADMSQAMRGLYEVSLSKFGDAVTMLRIEPPTDDAEKAMAVAVVKEEGDTATLTAIGATEGIPLKKVDGKWRVDMSKQIETQDMEQSTLVIRCMTKAARLATDDIRTGKITTIAAVRQSLQDRLQVLMADNATTAESAELVVNDPATRPAATQPTDAAPAPEGPLAPDAPVAGATQPGN